MCGIVACISVSGIPLNDHFQEHVTYVNRNHAIRSHDVVEPVNQSTCSAARDVKPVEAKRKQLDDQLKASILKLQHRGPDESGTWVDQAATVGLAHCRLSIHDLSPNGSQPLTSDDGEIHAVVNGEIYDHDRLRKICTTEHKYKFKGQSDSELVLALYKVYGAPGFCEHLRGEFALVLYDARAGKKRFIAVRDRYGIKPLVMTIVNGRLLLAAEAKAFLPLGWEAQWDISAVLESGWMTDKRTVFRGVQKLLPGHWLEITEERGLEIKPYWDMDYGDKKTEDKRSTEEMIRGVREHLIESIRLRMRADVPIGVYLSGGIDSSAIAGIVTKLAREDQVRMGSEGGKTRVTCFSISFPEASGFNESDIAERTAKWLGVETIKKDLDEETLASDFADAVYHSEQHHNDLNFVAKFCLSTLPREHGIKVVLTGEGADEHFAGYPFFPPDFLREPDLTSPDSSLVAQPQLRKDLQESLEQETEALLKGVGFEDLPEGDIINELNGSSVPTTLLMIQPTTSLFTDSIGELHKKCDIRRTIVQSYSEEVLQKIQEKWHPLHTGMYIWTRSSFVNILLSCLGDKTEMAHSVEARTPFLDHHLTEYLNGLPPSVKMRYTPVENVGVIDQGPMWKDAGKARLSIEEKWILKEAVRPFVTQELYERRKHPFLAPIRWPENGPLHTMLQRVLTKENVLNLGFVNYLTVENNLKRAFGENADTRAFRNVLFVAAWVTLAQRFGIKKVEGL